MRARRDEPAPCFLSFLGQPPAAWGRDTLHNAVGEGDAPLLPSMIDALILLFLPRAELVWEQGYGAWLCAQAEGA